MIKRICLLIISLVITCNSAHSETRKNAVEWLCCPDFGMIVKKEFEEVSNEDGTSVFRAMNKENGIIASVLGDKNRIDEITVGAGVSNENSLMLLLLLSYVSGSAIPEWKEAPEWTMSTITDLASSGGGEKNTLLTIESF